MKTMTFADVDAFVTELPGVAVETKWGNRTYTVGGKGFAWQRPFSKADLKRFGDEPSPDGEILAVRVDGLDAKDALLAIAPAGFFTIPHFNGYAAVLIALQQARPTDVRAAIRGGFLAMGGGAAPPPKRRAPKPKRKPKPKPRAAKPRRR